MKYLMNQKIAAIATAFYLLLASPITLADDETAQALLDEAKEIFAKRSPTNLPDDAIAKLQQAEQEVEEFSIKLQYKIRILHSQSLFYKGTQLSLLQGLKRIEIHKKGIDIAKKAHNDLPQYADAYYQHAAHLIAWSVLQDLQTQIDSKKEFEDLVETINVTPSMDGSKAGSHAGWGATRMEGLLNLKAPSRIRNSLDLTLETAVEKLGEAYKNAPHHSTNAYYYAEALKATGNPEEAKTVLKKLLAADPETLDPTRIPETKEDFELARKLLGTLE